MAKIAYLTDVEGQWHKLQDFARENPLVTLDGTTLSVVPGAIFVFGGDAVDRGTDARRIVHTLLDAKRRMPDQVVLLAGNRDINKLRLARELQGIFFYPLPDELKNADRPTLLKWIFRFTMGAPNAFAHRQAELKIEDEQAVAQSFLDDIMPGGELAEYLRVCQLAFRSGSTLFVHGGITDESLGHVPDHDQKIVSPDQWIDALNAWYRGQVQAFFDHASKDATHTGWSELIAYQAPAKFSRRNQASVVYGRTTDDHNNPHLPDAATMRALTDAGLHRVVVGHTPMGDTPSILRASDFEMVFADNCYAPLERGILVLLDDDALRVRAQGRTAIGEVVEIDFSLSKKQVDPLIGKRDADSGLLVKGPMVDGRYLLQRYGERFALEQTALGEDELRKRKLVEP
jgi:hypothetical protein